MSTPSLPSRYRLLSLLGEGGSGRVYRVHDAIRSRDLALKLVTSDETEFLQREFDTLRQIRHENLIQVFDWGTLPSGESYYTMELIDGEDWGKRMGRPQEAGEVRRILTGLLRGLAHLHCHREIHGDLKPGNVLLGLGGVVKLADAGMGGGDGRAEHASRTPGYAAPEVWEGSAADFRSDLYSVGVLGYEALTGVHPFAGRTIREVVAGQLEGWVPSPGVHHVRVPADLERAVMRALERDRALRQGSADEFMEGMGIEDRVGRILGGKFVGRSNELQAVTAALFTTRPASPSLLHLVGPTAVGKKSLLREVAHRIVRQGGKTFWYRDLVRRTVAGPSPPHQIAQSVAHWAPEWQNVSVLAGHLVDLAAESHVLVQFVHGETGSETERALVRNLARFIWARSTEANAPARVLIVECATHAPPECEDFERVIELRPFRRGETADFLDGRLGEARFEAELLDALHQLTGGFPGTLDAVIPSLTDRGLIDRRRGSWIFRENEQLRTLDLADLPNPWGRAWDRLPRGATRTLQALSLAPAGLSSSYLNTISGANDWQATLAALAAAGWVTRIGSQWQIASDGIRQVVRSKSDRNSLRDAAISIIGRPEVVGEEEAADLALEFDPSPAALERGCTAAVLARSRGDHGLEATRLRSCLAIAEAHGNPSAPMIALDLAQALHRVGADAEARAHLSKESLWIDLSDPAVAAQRHHMIGMVAFSLGDLEEARESFGRGIKSAREASDLLLEARCVAGLAEAGWQHGPEQLRNAAIEMIEGLIREHGNRGEITNEMGSLAYQLGSALIRAGEHRRAAEVLSRGLELATSDYWRMRIANALAAAVYYVGQFHAALEHIDLAWRLAERIGADSFKSRILANRAGLYYGLGRPADAVDQQKLAVLWARRTGGTFDYLTGCAGVSINLILLARYEDAISYAEEVRSAAEKLGDLDEVGKGHELEALARFYIGDYAGSEALVRRGLGFIAEAGYVSVRPRLDWLLGRLADARGGHEEALAVLRRAEADLDRTQDWEDLPGVQIELHRIQARSGDAEGHLAAIRELVWGKGGEIPFLVLVNGALAIAEVLVERQVDHADWLDLLGQALARSESAGIREGVWRLSAAVGHFCARDGATKESLARFRRGAQVLAEIAGELSSDHREAYLSTRHAKFLLHAMSTG